MQLRCRASKVSSVSYDAFTMFNLLNYVIKLIFYNPWLSFRGILIQVRFPYINLLLQVWYLLFENSKHLNSTEVDPGKT